MTRQFKIVLAVLLLGVAIGAIYLRGLHERVLRMARPTRTEEQAHREVTQPSVATPTDVRVKVKIFWASTTTPGALEPVEVELPLSGDPVQRAKQVISVLIASPPTPEQRTLPADAALLELYILADGCVIADFSGTLSTSTPSGILSERLAVESLARTMENNVAGVRSLKILVQGQELETLAGHIDLSGFFQLHPPSAPATPQELPADKLTPGGAPGKLER